MPFAPLPSCAPARRRFSLLLAGIVLALGACAPQSGEAQTSSEQSSGDAPTAQVTAEALSLDANGATTDGGESVVFERPAGDACLTPDRCTIPAPAVTVGGDGLRIEGGYFLASIRAPLEGRVTQEGNRLTLRVGLAAGQGQTIPTPLRYEASVQNLAAGTYRLRLVHERDGLRLPQGTAPERTALVLEQTVTVE